LTTAKEQVQIIEQNINDLNQIFLAKNDGILTGSDGFTLNNNLRIRHSLGPPKIINK
jgi:hypothetical protein